MVTGDHQIVTQTSLRVFRKCPRLYETEYVKLIRPVEVADALEFGDVWHKVRESWWGANKGNPRIIAAVCKLDELRSSPDFNLDEFALAKLIVMLRGYHARWCEYVDSIDIVGNELEFTIPISNPRTDRESRLYKISGKLDAVIRENGKLWVVEEKTASGDLTPESPYWRRLEIDPQCSIYYYAVTHLFAEVPAGVKYFVNVKSQKRPLKKTANPKYKTTGELYANQRAQDESAEEYAVRMAQGIKTDPEKYYQMVEVARLEKSIEESQIDVWDTVQAIRQAEKSGVFLRNPDACIHPFGSTCPFLPVCANRASLDDPQLYRKAEVAHEELAAVSAG